MIQRQFVAYINSLLGCCLFEQITFSILKIALQAKWNSFESAQQHSQRRKFNTNRQYHESIEEGEKSGNRDSSDNAQKDKNDFFVDSTSV